MVKFASLFFWGYQVNVVSESTKFLLSKTATRVD